MSLSNIKHLSHAYIIVSPSTDIQQEKAIELTKSFVCSGSGAKPCGVCRDCKKAAGQIHPDVITIDLEENDSGVLRKEITVEQIRFMVRDAYIMPIESDRKVYIIKNADKINLNGQNSALKILEEPPASAAFILCASNLDSLLITVRSRCTIISDNAEITLDEESMELADSFLQIVSSGNRATLNKWCFEHDNLNNTDALNFIQATISAITNILSKRKKDIGISRIELLKLVDLLEKCLKYLSANVSVKNIMSLLAVNSIPDRKVSK